MAFDSYASRSFQGVTTCTASTSVYILYAISCRLSNNHFLPVFDRSYQQYTQQQHVVTSIISPQQTDKQYAHISSNRRLLLVKDLNDFSGMF